MNQKRLHFFHFIFIWTAFYTQAQIIKTDTASNKVFIFNMSEMEWLNDSLIPTDTVLREFHLKHTSLSNQTAIQNQGMWGTPERNLEMQVPFRKYFNEGIYSFESLRKPFSDQYAVSGKPVSDLHYVQGYPQMIYITAKHSQNLGQYASFGVDYRRLKMQNIYFNNLPELDRNRIPNLYNTRVYFRFDHPNKRYMLLVQTISNKITQQETGGIQNEGRFDSLGIGARLFNQSAPLVDGVNKFRDLGIQIHQIYTLRKNDTAELKGGTRIFHRVIISQNRNQFNLSLSDSGYFSHFYSGSTTADQQQFLNINNEAGIGRSSEKWRTRVSVLQQTIKFTGSYDDRALLGNLFLKASALYNNQGTLSGFTGDFGIGGYNSGDIYLRAFHLRKLSPLKTLNVALNTMIVEPDFQQRYYYGNHYRWNQKLLKQQNINSELAYTFSGKHPLKAEIQGGSLRNFVYFSNQGYPVQHTENEVWYKIKIDHTLDFKRWNVQNTLIYQQVSEDILPLPKALAKSSWYLKGWIFKENMYFESGIDFFYHDAFNAPVYNPATRQFQLNGKEKYGNYPIGDIFLNARIRTVSLMLRIHHINQGVYPESSYILSPGYPILPRSFSFGVRWLLTN